MNLPPRFQEQPILVEQLQLVLSNALIGFGGSWLTALVVSVTLSGQPGLLPWFAIYTLICICCTLYVLRHPVVDPGQVERVSRVVIVITSTGGMLWGALLWIAFKPDDIAGSALLLSTIIGICGAALSMMSPFLLCYLIFLVAVLAPLSIKLLQQNDPIYFAIWLASVIYAVAMYYFARFSHNAVLGAIKLRFENIQLLAQLQAARDQALAANSAKSKLLAAASHDLRQPLHAMTLFLEALSRSGLSPPQQEIFTNAKLAANASRDLLNTLLDFSRIEAGVINMAPCTFYLQPLFNRLEKELGGEADHKNLIYRSRETPLAVYADPALSAQILRNLISNAIRYTEQGGVLIGCRNREQFAVVEVWDTGIGIPQAQTEEIFREFYQLGNPEQDRKKGLGLGLAIVKGLAKTMGVEVTVASKSGQGSVFRLSLPLATDRSGAIIQGIAAEELIIGLNGERILVIDDDVMVLEGMRVLLASWHCAVDCAETIDAALALANMHPPDLVITDYRLREAHTGGEAIAVLRERISRTLPAIIITGDTAPERLREALTTDAVLLHKPVVASQLNAAMVRILMKH